MTLTLFDTLLLAALYSIIPFTVPLFLFIYAVVTVLCLAAAYLVKRYDGLEE